MSPLTLAVYACLAHSQDDADVPTCRGCTAATAIAKVRSVAANRAASSDLIVAAPRTTVDAWYDQARSVRSPASDDAPATLRSPVWA